MMVASLLFSFWRGSVVKRVLVIRSKFGDLRCSNNSFEFFKVPHLIDPNS